MTAVLALLSFVVPLGTDMYLPAFPRMADELGTDASGVQLTLTAFLVGIALGQLVLGPLSDRWGRRRPMLVGMAVCTVATALCALAPSLAWLVVLRFVMGFAGAAGIVVPRAVVSDIASGASAARLFGILVALGGIAPIVAPLAGGAVVVGAGWRAVFWVLAGMSLLMLLGTLLAVPESLPPERRHGKDSAGTLSAVGSVLTNRAYLGYTFAFSVGCGALYCYIAGSAFLYQKVLDQSVTTSSVLFAGGALTATLSSFASARLVGSVRPGVLLRVGLGTMTVTTAALLLITLADLLTMATALPLLGVFFLGLGQIFANATALAIEQVPHAAGTASAVLGALQSALAGVVSPLVGLGGEETAVPLFIGMTACSVLAGASLLLTRNAGQAAGATGPEAATPAVATATSESR
jgi:DHA1 family bicyclomycin/chloramphenicol resistance-like MFS transporter